MTAVPLIFSQYAEEAAFHWLLRDAAVGEPHYSLADLAKLDGRLEAHLDGLRIAGDPGWEIVRTELAWEEPGEVFAGAVLALESGDPLRVEEVLAVADASPDLARGVVSALGWVSYAQAYPHLQPLLDSGSPVRRRIAIAALAVHRQDPGRLLDHLATHAEPPVRARALRAIGELGRTDLLSHCWSALHHDDAECRFWAGWSGALLGDRELVVPILAAQVTDAGPHAERACGLLARCLPAGKADAWQRQLAEAGAHRLAILAAGAIGDPALVPWLIGITAVAETARPAGEALSHMTGLDLAYEDLEGERPEGFEAGATENPEDEDVAMDPDEDLPWPDPERVARWWSGNQGRFPPGICFLLGQPIDDGALVGALRTGRQRQRAAAALELALRHPGKPLFEVRARGDRQRRILGV